MRSVLFPVVVSYSKPHKHIQSFSNDELVKVLSSSGLVSTANKDHVSVMKGYALPAASVANTHALSIYTQPGMWA